MAGLSAKRNRYLDLVIGFLLRYHSSALRSCSRRCRAEQDEVGTNRLPFQELRDVTEEHLLSEDYVECASRPNQARASIL